MKFLDKLKLLFSKSNLYQFDVKSAEKTTKYILSVPYKLDTDDVKYTENFFKQLDSFYNPLLTFEEVGQYKKIVKHKIDPKTRSAVEEIFRNNGDLNEVLPPNEITKKSLKKTKTSKV